MEENWKIRYKEWRCCPEYEGFKNKILQFKCIKSKWNMTKSLPKTLRNNLLIQTNFVTMISGSY